MVATLLSIVLPDAGDIPGISGEAVLTGAVLDGQCWLRILETDYAVLMVSADPAVSLTAYDDSGEPVAVSPDGSPLVLSAYSEYWFWIKADSEDPVEFAVEYVEPSEVSSNSVSSGLSSAEMAEIWTFHPGSDGRWNFVLRGVDDSADLDLELYGPGDRLWAGSYSVNSAEKLSMNLLGDEEVQVVVSRFNKGGNGEYSIEMSRAGDFPVLESSTAGDAASGNVQRYLVPDLGADTFLEMSYQNEGDLDIYIRDRTGEALYSSTTYLFSEGLLLPRGSSPGVAEVYPYELDSDLESFPYLISLNPLQGDISANRAIDVETGYGRSPLVSFTAPSRGFYTFATIFDKLRDGDIRLFEDYGEPSVFLTTERGDESFSFWLDRGERVWLVPGFIDSSTGGLCGLSVEPTEAEMIAGLVHGRIDGTTSAQKYYTVTGEAGSTLVIQLRGDQRNFDLDMLVSGPGYVLQAEGGLSNTDNAADESVTLYCREDALYGITVYAYERNGEGTFTIESERIPAERLAPGDSSAETWAVVSGISGYQSRADILSRASMDAIDFYRFLRDEQNIDPDHIILLVDAEATADMFENAVADVTLRAGSEDRLIIFYSGHGSQESPGSGGKEEADGVNEVLCFYDRDVSDDRLRELITAFPGYSYLFADACHSGGLVNDFYPGDDVLVVTAAKEDRSVSERILTPILLEASRGAADSSGDGIITAGELVQYVDGMLARICPVCDAVVSEGMAECPECGTVLKGEYRIPRPEQGLFLPENHPVWR